VRRFTNLSAISKQLLLAIEEKQNLDKSIECVIGTIYIRNSADVELAVYDKKLL
jgi:hexosaminidase